MSKMRVATPMLMQALPMEGMLQGVRTTPGPWKGKVLSRPEGRCQGTGEKADPGKA